MISSHEVLYSVIIGALHMLEIAPSGHQTMSSDLVYDSVCARRSQTYPMGLLFFFFFFFNYNIWSFFFFPDITIIGYSVHSSLCSPLISVNRVYLILFVGNNSDIYSVFIHEHGLLFFHSRWKDDSCRGKHKASYWFSFLMREKYQFVCQCEVHSIYPELKADDLRVTS